MDIEKKQVETNSYFLKNQDKKITNVNGRLYFDYVVLTIHENINEYQGNYLCWLEENIINNLDSAQNMPLLAQFTDETKSEPLGHGWVTHRNGKTVIVDSEQVGSVIKAEIRNVDVDGKQVKALVATGYINETRYPALCQWLRATIFESKKIDTSIEILSKKDKESIISDFFTIEDDVIVEVPKEFDFGGSAILTVTPADENAIVLEILNSRKQDAMKEAKKISENEIVNSKEDTTLLKTKEDEKVTIEEMQEKLNILEQEKETMNAEKIALEEKVTTLEQEKENAEKAKCAAEEVKCSLEEESKCLNEKLNSLQEENKSLIEFKTLRENEILINSLETEISDFEESLKEEVKEDIAEFMENPTAEKSDVIINTLNSLFVKKAKELANNKKEEKDVKLNSLFVDLEKDDKEEEKDVFKVWE